MNNRFLCLAAAVVAVGCGAKSDDSAIESQITRTGIDLATGATDSELHYQFDHLTPTGKTLFDAAQLWEKSQWSYRDDRKAKRVFATPEPRMCAGNLSQVYFMTAIASLRRNYRWTAVDEVSSSIGDNGGKVVNFSKSKSRLIDQFNNLYHGRIPVGSVAGGCLQLNSDGTCKRIDGSRHIGMVGNTITLKVENGVSTDVIMTYHNNWYRSENAGGQYFKFMVSKRNQDLGFPRQFMAVPWLEVDRDLATDKIIDIRSALMNPTTGQAAIDDMDPFTFNAFIAIPKEIAAEIAQGKSQTTDGLGAINPLGQIDETGVASAHFCYTAADPAGTKVLLRDQPGGSPVGSVNDGEQLKILSKSGNFYQAESSAGVLGFVHRNQFAPCGDIDD
jgi:hypothetical protein